MSEKEVWTLKQELAPEAKEAGSLQKPEKATDSPAPEHGPANSF